MNCRQIALEIFSGSGHFSAAWRRSAHLKHVPIFEIDLKNHPSHDLLSKQCQNMILGWIRSGLVVAVWLGTPCTSFSRARDVPPGPPPLRSDNQPYGLPGLSAADQLKVRIGNELAWFSVRVLTLCASLRIAAALENPWTSRIWLFRGFRRLRRRWKLLATDYCQDGMPWRKRTGLLSVCVDLTSAVRLCVGPRGICSRTGERHVELRGLDNGRFRTLLAEPYPRRLCTRLVSCFKDALIANKVIPLDFVVGISG